MWNGGWLSSLTLNNVRDLGGMPAQDGRRIRKNRLIRAGALTGATEEDISVLKEHDVRTIIDLRSDEEIAGSPDPVIAGIRYIKSPLLPSRSLGITHEEEMLISAKKMNRGQGQMVSM